MRGEINRAGAERRRWVAWLGRVVGVPVVLRIWLAQIADAWRAKNVRRGFYGTLLITLGAFSPAYLPRNSPWWQMLSDADVSGWPAKLTGTLLTMVGLFLLLDAWFRLRPRKNASEPEQYVYYHVRHWAILLIWGAPFLFAPPIFSHDAYSYAAQGWLIHNNINPYEAGPAVLPGAFADQVSWVWRDTPAPYGPLALQLQHAIVDVMGFRPYASAVAMRILALVGVGLIGLLIPRIARIRGADPAFAAWFGTLNPVLVIDFVGGSHNDSLMMGLVVAGLWVTLWGAKPTGEGLETGQERSAVGGLEPGLPADSPSGRRWRTITDLNWWWLVGAVLIGLGATIKQPAIMAAYALPLMARPWANWSVREVAITAARVLASFAVAIGTFCLVSLATGLGFGWINAVSVPGRVVTIAPFTVIGQAIQLVLNLFGLDPSGWAAITVSRTVGVIFAAVVIAAMAVTIARARPILFLALGYLTAALSLPAVRSWYMLWGGLLLPVAAPPRRVVNIAVWTTVVLLCYNGINMAWRNDTMALGFAAAAGIAWLARTHGGAAPGTGNRRRRIPAGADHIELQKD